MKKNKCNISYISILSIMLIITIWLTGCINNGPEQNNGYFYSFEKDMQGWVADGTDLSGPSINWIIEQSEDFASDGNKSVKFFLNNLNDAGKIWMEKELTLDANSQYEIKVSYHFATSDYGDFNLFKIITGVTKGNPEDINDLTFQQDTGHHQDEDIGYVWLNKTYNFTIQTDTTGVIYISIGVWGSWETARTYYVDAVDINITKLTRDDVPDISGQWNLSFYNFEGNLTKQEKITITQNITSIQIANETETWCDTVLIKNSGNMNIPTNVQYVITNCDFNGLGIQYIYVYNETFMKTDLPLCENCAPVEFTRDN